MQLLMRTERMERLSLIRLLLVVGALAFSLLLRAASDNDQLYQVNLAEFPKYRALSLGKLGPTPFNCGRVIVQPAFAPEYSVSVYSRSLAQGGMKYFVTYIAPDQSLWETSDAGRNPQNAENANVRRIDCEIPKEIAEKVKQVWLGMLTGNQSPTPMRAEDAARATDATIAEFSIEVPPAETLYGEIPAEVPKGPKTKTLVGLANALTEYCKAKPMDRSAIAGRVDREATRLLEMIKRG